TEVKIESGTGERVLFAVMKPQWTANGIQLAALAVTGEERNSGGPTWLPARIDESIPEVNPGVACPLSEVLQKAEKRSIQIVGNLERFTATERVEHFVVDATGQRRKPDVRKFDYVVDIPKNKDGTFFVEEYRNGNSEPGQFPAHIATQGLPALALIFHP